MISSLKKSGLMTDLNSIEIESVRKFENCYVIMYRTFVYSLLNILSNCKSNSYFLCKTTRHTYGLKNEWIQTTERIPFGPNR